MSSMLPPSRTTVEKNILRCRRADEFSHSLGQSRPGRADGKSGHVAFPPIATEFCGAAKFRYVPEEDILMKQVRIRRDGLAHGVARMRARCLP
jgi:hypothetical protein